MASQEIPVHTLLQDDYKDVIIIFFLSDLCNFDDSPCPWKIGNWTVAKDCVPSNSLGTGPCLDKNGGTSKWNWEQICFVTLVLRPR